MGMTTNEAIEILRKNRPTSDPRPCGMELCDAVDMAISALRQQETVTNRNEPLTLDELSKRNDPVFVPINDFPNGGYWCLCENGYIIPPSGHGFMAKERPNWVFYSRKPEEDDHDERKENENV